MGHKSSCHSLFADVFFGTDRSQCLPETNICLCVTTTTTSTHKKLLGSSDDRTCGTVCLPNRCISVLSCWIYSGLRRGWREYFNNKSDRTNPTNKPECPSNIYDTANFSESRLYIEWDLMTTAHPPALRSSHFQMPKPNVNGKSNTYGSFNCQTRTDARHEIYKRRLRPHETIQERTIYFTQTVMRLNEVSSCCFSWEKKYETKEKLNSSQNIDPKGARVTQHLLKSY